MKTKIKDRQGVRALLAERDGLACHWCGCWLTIHTADTLPGVLEFATIEHLQPLVCGGTDDPANLRLACQKCNQSRPLVFRPTFRPSTAGQFKEYTSHAVPVFADSPPEVLQLVRGLLEKADRRALTQKQQADAGKAAALKRATKAAKKKGKPGHKIPSCYRKFYARGKSIAVKEPRKNVLRW